MKLLIQITLFLSLLISSSLRAQCLNVAYTISNVICHGSATGAIHATPNSGQSPYTYTWSTGTTTVSANFTIPSLVAGSHTVTVVDNLGCDDVMTLFITEPTAVIATITNQTDVSCLGDSTGTATVTGAGGTIATGYSYLWDANTGGQTNATATGLSSGTYSVTVSDNSGCINVTAVNISQPLTAISLTAAVTSNYNGHDIDCNGNSTGEATVTAIGGTPGYSYSWNSGQVTSSITGLSAGAACVTVIDANGCIASTCVTLTEPTAVTATITNVTHINCFGDSTGTATVTGTGGATTSGYSILWSANAGWQTAATATMLAANMPYSVLITDVNGCEATTHVTLMQPVAILSTAAIISSNYNGSNISCNGDCDGAITASTAGGTIPYSYSWLNSGSTSSTATGLCAGSHCLVVTDFNGCTATQCVTITEPDTLIATSSTLRNSLGIPVFGPCGSVRQVASVLGGTTTSYYNYQWSASAGGGTTDTSGWLVGSIIHTCIVTDDNGCFDTIFFDFNNTAYPGLTVNAGPDQQTCSAACNNSFTISSSGVAPFSYSINGGVPDTVNTISNLCIGQYIIEVTDAHGCMGVDTVNITGSSASLLTATISTQDTLCYGNSGVLRIISSGGVAPFTYDWGGGPTILDTFAINVPGLQYCVTVTDNNACTTTACIIPDSINFEVEINAATLNGEKVGLTTQNSAYTIQTTSSHPSQSLYNWSPATDLSCSVCSTPSASPNLDTKYILTATHNTLGCISKDSISIFSQITDTLRFEVAFDSTVNHCSNLPSFLTGGTSSIIGNSLNHGSVTYGATGCFDYTSNGIEGIDTIIWVDCVTANIGVLPVQICDTTIIYISTMGCVWPGDADNDGIANNFDLLPIGLHHGATGTNRTNATIVYSCQPSFDWGATITNTPTVDIKHVDCNGNGLINSLDTNAIILNWSQTHLKSSTSSSAGVDIYVDTAVTAPGTTISLPIILGSSPNNGYGIAFTVNYDPSVIDTNSVSIDFSNSWLGTINNDMIGISKDFYYQGQVEVGMTRINQATATGSGTIGHINLTIKDDVLPKSNYLRADFTITNVRYIDNNGVLIPTNNIPTQILVSDALLNKSTIHKTNKSIKVHPNPTKGKIYLQNTLENMDHLMIYDLTGKIVQRKSNINSQNVNVNIADLPTGIYMLRVTSSTQAETIQIIKQ